MNTGYSRVVLSFYRLRYNDATDIYTYIPFDVFFSCGPQSGEILGNYISAIPLQYIRYYVIVANLDKLQ